MELKPCPFCGQVQDETTPEMKFLGEGPPPGYACICGYCGAEGPMGTGHERGDHTGGKKAAADAWNRRAPAAPPVEAPDLMKAAEIVESCGYDLIAAGLRRMAQGNPGTGGGARAWVSEKVAAAFAYGSEFMAPDSTRDEQWARVMKENVTDAILDYLKAGGGADLSFSGSKKPEITQDGAAEAAGAGAPGEPGEGGGQ
jgi:Lar family restriction alleviation protein